MARPIDYDADGFIHFIEKRTGETHWIGKDDKLRQMPTTEMFEVGFDYIENLNLNKVGNEIPFTNNNVSLERYMMYYWKAIMDSECILLYLHLWEYCIDRDKGVDIVYPKMKELAERLQISKPTLLKKLKMLEDNNFLIVIHRLNKRRDNKESSPLIKLRRTIPLLTKEQYFKLTPFLQRKHDDYMKNFASESQLERFGTKGSDTVDSIINDVGDRIVSKKTRQEIKNLLRDEQDEAYIMVNLPSPIRETLIEASDLIEGVIDAKVLSKPSAEYYFSESTTVYDKNSSSVHIILRKKVTKDFLNSGGLTDKQRQGLVEYFSDKFGDVSELQLYTTEEYIVSMMKGF